MSDGQQFKLSLPEALKLSTILIGVIAITVGHHGHYESPVRKQMITVEFEETCKEDGLCPQGCMAMEKSFMAIVTIFLVLSAIFFIVGAVIDLSDGVLKIVDVVFQFVSAFLVIIAGCLMLVSAIRIDDFVTKQQIDKGTHSCYVNSIHKQVDILKYPCFHRAKHDTQADSEGLRLLFQNEKFLYCPSAEFSVKKGEGCKPPKDTYSSRLEAFRDNVLFPHKISAGVMALLMAILYILVGVFILVGGGGGCGGGGGGGGGNSGGGGKGQNPAKSKPTKGKA